MQASSNPTSDEVTVFFSDKVSGSLTLTSLHGVVVHRNTLDGSNQQVIDISAMDNGLYVVTLITQLGQTETLKLVIID